MITVQNRQFTSSSPIASHPTHDSQHSETQFHVAKATLKRKAAETDFHTKHMVAKSVTTTLDTAMAELLVVSFMPFLLLTAKTE